MPLTLYEMSPADNVLYFPNNVDVRLCPKNGMSSLKELFRLYRKHDSYVGRSYRYTKVKREGSQFDIPFRKGSYRIAIGRDPLERFKSACEYIAHERIDHIKKGRNDLPSISLDIHEVLDNMENGHLKNNHFYTQSWYMGSPDQYDAVYCISELPQALAFIKDACELDITDADKIYKNKTFHKLYHSALTEDQIDRIKKLYHKDYNNGWCPQN